MGKICHYVNFKQNYVIEKKHQAIDIKKFRTCMARYRSSAHSFMLEKCRYYDSLLHIGIVHFVNVMGRYEPFFSVSSLQ
jgi:hypothetical protein